MYTSIHNVQSVEVTEMRVLSCGSAVRDIIIIHKDGNRVELTLFAELAEQLKVQVNGAVNLKL